MAMDFIHTLRIESWTMYSVGMFLIACRLISRRLRLGSWKLGPDDWLMVFASANFTGVMVSVNAVAVNGSSYMDPEVAAALTEEEKQHAIYGSIMTFVLEIFTLTCIWTVKACLLILYYRLTASLHKQQIAVLCIAGYCVIAYILVVALLVGYWCTPTYEYWAVPYNNSQCATYYNHMIFATAWNISSDLMLLAIPFPIVFKTQLPLKRKIGLCAILVAILNRYFNFNNPNDLGYVYFYVAEVATAIYVGNIPLCWPLIQLIFQTGPWSRQSGSDSRSHGQDPNRPRTKITTYQSRHRTGRDRKDMGADGSNGSGDSPYICPANVADDQTSTVELTKPWGDNQADLHTEVRAGGSRGHSEEGGTFWLGDGEEREGKSRGNIQVTKTVHVTAVSSAK
ncbi:hypothetical protein B0T16DRAFT_387718 [Cercophora newfieldiana]|uniref:Rhodopsin domain-containing protein n=1 Tax=Cercophora newfieldiana TaxID=92897 RepID=A0AA40CUZ4_9PEZI|nr:hypothetical protein B0T16DRAFT_387718 [Cercophora newfieldiana]